MFAGAAGLATGRNRVKCDCRNPVDKLPCAETVLSSYFQRMLLVQLFWLESVSKTNTNKKPQSLTNRDVPETVPPLLSFQGCLHLHTLLLTWYDGILNM